MRMAEKLMKNEINSHLFLVKLKMRLDPAMSATKKINITIEK